MNPDSVGFYYVYVLRSKKMVYGTQDTLMIYGSASGNIMKVKAH